MLSFAQFCVEAKVDGIQHTVTPLKGGGHIVAAFHKDHQKGLPQLGPIFTKHVKKPEGHTAKNMVGYAIMRTGDDWAGSQHHYSDDTQVHPNWQRKGIATDMYHKSQEHSGKTVIPSHNQSDEAKKFWQASK